MMWRRLSNMMEKWRNRSMRPRTSGQWVCVEKTHRTRSGWGPILSGSHPRYTLMPLPSVPKKTSCGQRESVTPSSNSAIEAGIMEQSAPVSMRKSNGRSPRRVRTNSGMTGSATRPSEITLVPIGNSITRELIDTDRFLRRDVANDQTLAVETAFADDLEQLGVRRAAGEDLAVLAGDELAPVASLKFGVRNDGDVDTRLHVIESITRGCVRQLSRPLARDPVMTDNGDVSDFWQAGCGVS